LESNWSFNVWKYGLVGVFSYRALTKCARTLEPFYGGQIMSNCWNGIGQYLAIWLPGEVIPDAYYFQFYFRGPGNFPYGAVVEPD